MTPKLIEKITVGEAAIPSPGCGTFELRGEAGARIVAEALRLGFRHIDTAQGYANEEEVGEGLRASGIPRDEVFITTKVRPQLISDGVLQKSVEESLRRLQIDVIDLLLIHWPNPAIPIQESMKALSDAKRRGLTRHIGVSNFTAATLEQAVSASPEPIVSNQFEYHPYLDQTALLATTRRLGLAVTAYSPMALGKVARDPALAEIGARYGKTSVQVALRWLIQQRDVIPIPRTSKSERLRENLSLFDFRLTSGEMVQIANLPKSSAHLINEPGWVPQWD